MNWIGHKIGGMVMSGVVGVGTLATTSSIKMAGINAVTAYIFALYPDMDISSISRKFLTFFGLIALVPLILTGHLLFAGILLGMLIFPRFMPHRGFNHSLAMMLIVAFLWGFMLPGAAVAVMAGFATHLVLDGFYIRLV